MLPAAEAVRSQKRCLRQEIACSRQRAIQSNLSSLRTGTPIEFCAVPQDVTNEAQAKAAVESAIASFGALDVPANNAGYG